ncbi:MAG: molybdopterin-guanine dinucleotide biosynthesis protein B [Betaproteobacteria bacterium]|nr:molybdopterin-guanine dinucleotide biosynthesis protein B [Betaproteobacteria bacterium]
MKKVFGFAGWSGSGKTTLIERVVPRLVAHGVKVSVIKHTHHGFDIDRPGKDSWRHREAGATEVLLTSGERWVLMHELRGAPEPGIERQLEILSPCDVVLVEGFKDLPIPKIEVHRPAHGRPLMFPDNPHVVAVAADAPIDTRLPLLDLNDASAIGRFIMRHVGLQIATGDVRP